MSPDTPSQQAPPTEKQSSPSVEVQTPLVQLTEQPPQPLLDAQT